MLFSKLFELFKHVVHKVQDLTNYHQIKYKYQNNKMNHLDQKLIRSLRTPKVPTLKQSKFLLDVLSQKEKRIIGFLGVVMFFSLVFIMVHRWQDNNSRTVLAGTEGGTLKEGVIGSPQYINPLFSHSNPVDQDLVALIFSGLYKYNSDLKVVPDLVDKHSISGDGKVYRISLKKDVVWPDGKSFSSEDVLFTIQSMQHPDLRKLNPMLYNTWKDVQVKTIDDFTVELTIARSFTPFLENLTIGILPKHLLKDVSTAINPLSEFNLKPVGLGPFQFKSMDKDKAGMIKSYTLMKNDKYFDKAPWLENIIFSFYDNHEEAVGNLRSRVIDSLTLAPHEAINVNLKKFNTYDLVIPKYTAIFFNGLNNQLLNNLAVRQSLSLSVDRNKIIKMVLNNHGVVSRGPIVIPEKIDSTLVQTNTDGKDLYNFQKAEEILVSNKWYKEDGYFKKKNSNNAVESLQLTLVTIDHPENVKAAMFVKEDWEKLGVKVKLDIYSTEDIYYKVIEPRKYDALLYAEQLGADPDPYPYWHSLERKSPGLNLALFNNPEADKLLEEARGEHNFEIQRKKYLAFQELLFKEYPAVFLYNSFSQYIVNSQVQNIQTKNVVNLAGRLEEIENWYIKVKRVLK